MAEKPGIYKFPVASGSGQVQAAGVPVVFRGTLRLTVKSLWLELFQNFGPSLAGRLTWQVAWAQSTEKRITTNHTNGRYRALLSARIPGKPIRVYTNHTNRKEQSECNACPTGY
jgi:hypothetical protein